MKLLLTLFSIVAVLQMSGCGGSSGSTLAGEQNDPTDNPDTGDGSGTLSARYRVTFDATWSADTHPVLFPDNPHFSGLVGSVHNEQVIYWQPGGNATDGIEVMAETGDKSVLLDEVEIAIDSGYALSFIDGGGVSTSPGSVSIEVDVSIDYPLLTVTSMLAPSPDWFVGVHNLPLHDGQQFVQLQTVELSVYDAGTDSGERYTSRDQQTSPRDPISLVNSFPTDSPFFNGLPSIGRFVIEKL